MKLAAAGRTFEETILAISELNKALATVAIQQLVHDWASELDLHDGLNMAGFVSKDCTYHVRGLARQGRDAVVKFYIDRLSEFHGNKIIMTQRHAISTIRPPKVRRS